MKGIYKYRYDVDVILENCPITIVIGSTHLTKDQHAPSKLIMYS